MFVRKKIVAFVVFCSLVFVLLVGFGLICVFYAQNLFVKKKKKGRLEIVLITSCTILLGATILLRAIDTFGSNKKVHPLMKVLIMGSSDELTQLYTSMVKLLTY